jgi:hypothetical protein
LSRLPLLLSAGYQTISEDVGLAIQFDRIVLGPDFSPIGNATVFGDGLDVGGPGKLPREFRQMKADRKPGAGGVGQRGEQQSDAVAG